MSLPEFSLNHTYCQECGQELGCGKELEVGQTGLCDDCQDEEDDDTPLTHERLMKRLQDQGLEPRSYSGRGMYGKCCVGVSLNHLGQATLPKGYSTDSLGKGIIAYWRNIEWAETE